MEEAGLNYTFDSLSKICSMGKGTKIVTGRAPLGIWNMADILSTTGMLDYLPHGSVVDKSSIFRGQNDVKMPNPGISGLECSLLTPNLR